MSGSSHSTWRQIVIVVLIIAIAVPAFTIRSIDTHMIIGALIVIGIILYLVIGRGGKLSFRSEDSLYEELVRKCRGDRALANRLIEYERKRNPDAEIAELLQDAIDRLSYDRR